jgi:glutamine cyclotransferase
MRLLQLQLLPVFAISLIFLGCGDSSKPETTETKDPLALEYSILSTLPHNPQAYTQGLVAYNGKILESTGQNGTSWIAEVNPASGEHDKKVILDKQYFGEGITVLNNKLYHLTYTTKIGFIYDARTYKKIKEFEFDKAIRQGWGLTHDNKNLIVSDGTDKLHFLDTTTLKVIRSLPVTEGNIPVDDLNELEYIDGYVFANIYTTNLIVKIDPSTGKVVGKLDLTTLGEEIKNMFPNTDVLNGIAYDKNSRAMLITGKLWPKSYLIRLK